MAMEFWGVEVKAGEPLKVEPEDGFLVHLSQASLGEAKKDKNEAVLLSVNIDGKKIVLGTLSFDKCPQISYDLVFEKEFELSHNWKNGSVYFCGYKAEMQEDGSEGSDMFESESEEEDEPIVAAENGKAEAKTEKPKAPAEKAKLAKPDSSAAKNVKDAKPPSNEDDDSDEDDSDDDEDDDSDDEEMADGVNDDDSSDEEDEDSSDEEDEDAPKNVKQGKKRPVESATKTPAPEKKAKLVTPQKSGGDGKKGSNAHTATPHPSKQAGKAKADKAKPQTPKSGGPIACKSCSKTFNSDGALQSHTKAKHSDAK